MKVNTKDTDSPFEKCFAKCPFNYEKKLRCQIGSAKAFDEIDEVYKVDEVSGFCISKGSSKQFCNFISGANLCNIE